MGKKGKKDKAAASSAESDDALLDAAIAENRKHLTAIKEAAAAVTTDSPIAGRYEAYKRATSSFLDWLALKSPTFAVRTVRSILMAAGDLHLQGVTLPSNMAQNLRNAITLRKEVHRLYRARAQKLSADDERHAHFIEALERAQLLLAASSAVQSSGAPAQVSAGSSASPEHLAEQHPADELLTLANRFEGLHVEETAEAPGTHSTSAEDRLSMVGSVVVVQGVESQPELNGRSAEVTGYNASKGRYEVNIDGPGGTIRLKPTNVRRVRSMGVAEEEKYVLGATMEFEAACLLLDLEGVLKEVDAAWDDCSHGRCSLLAAAALTNACVRHAERLASAAELHAPLLNSLEHITCVAYMMRTVTWVQNFLGVPLEVALKLVSDIAHGVTGDTVLPMLGGQRVLHGVQLYAALAAEELRPLPQSRRSAAAAQLEKARQQLRSYPQCAEEQVDAVLRRVTDDVIDRLAKRDMTSLVRTDDGDVAFQDPEDFYVGGNGLLLTASFLRVLASPQVNIVKRPKVWSAPKPGFFGPMWDEELNPAECTNDLTDYLGSVLPALLNFADGEMRTKGGKQLVFPALKMQVLMPLWQILEVAMDRQAATLPLTIAVQAMLMSVVRTNGGGFCMRVQTKMRSAFTKAREQIDADLAVFAEAAANGCPNSQINKQNLEMLSSWVDFTERRHTTTPFDRAGMGAISARQRDHSLLQNPWVAGQQLLVLSLGVGIGCGSAILDSLGQTSFVLHLHNALRVVGAARSVPLLDDILMPVLGSDNKAVWFAGVPRSNFMKAWFHRMGMDANTRTNRKLVPIEAADLSPAYRCVAEDDFSLLPIAESTNPLPIMLNAIRVAFTSDTMVGLNLAALGAKLAALPERLVDLLRMHEHVQRELAELLLNEEQSNHGKARRKGRGGPADEKSRRAAVHTTLVAELFQRCEQDVPDQNEPLHIPGKAKYVNPEGREFQGRKSLPPCTPADRRILEYAGTVVQEFVQSIKATDFTMISPMMR